MNPTRSSSSRGQIQPAVALLLGAAAIAGLVAILVWRPVVVSGGPAPSPIVRPYGTPVAVPSTAPSASPKNGAAGVDLQSATGHDVSVKVHDESGSVVKAVSGTPGDGMSIRWHDADVRNVDARTIAIKWAAFPQDEVVDLGVSSVSGRYELTLVQAGPYPYTDAMGEDRILNLAFNGPVS
ncbi:MAG TPA: hypothetical protein VFY18_08440, partial [Candidatus Limnocylindrales bacterium]|nr:hypothetical protein [Candidatus Limnocylindrales bacterium]